MAGNGGIAGLIAKRMEWLTHRQGVIAKNIANADTPEFVPQDLKESSFLKELRRQTPVGPVRTHVAHLGADSPGAQAKASDRADLYEASPSGNSVVLEQEMMKMTEVHSQHTLMVNLYKKHMQLMKMVLRGASR